MVISNKNWYATRHLDKEVYRIRCLICNGGERIVCCILGLLRNTFCFCWEAAIDTIGSIYKDKLHRSILLKFLHSNHFFLSIQMVSSITMITISSYDSIVEWIFFIDDILACTEATLLVHDIID